MNAMAGDAAEDRAVGKRSPDLAEMSMTIIKASLDKGVMRWRAVASARSRKRGRPFGARRSRPRSTRQFASTRPSRAW